MLSCLVFGSTTSSRLQKTSPLRLKDEAFVDSMDKDNVEGEGVGGAGVFVSIQVFWGAWSKKEVYEAKA